MTDEATIIKRRIEACVMQAQMNARNHGGDNATAAMDLICAFALITVKSGGDPDAMLKKSWENAKLVVADFWPEARVNGCARILTKTSRNARVVADGVKSIATVAATSVVARITAMRSAPFATVRAMSRKGHTRDTWPLRQRAPDFLQRRAPRLNPKGRPTNE